MSGTDAKATIRCAARDDFAAIARLYEHLNPDDPPVTEDSLAEEKIRSRWRRLWENVAAMIELADSAEVFDNTGSGPVTVATFVAGDIVGAPRWPDWMPEGLATRWPTSDRSH